MLQARKFLIREILFSIVGNFLIFYSIFYSANLFSYFVNQRLMPIKDLFILIILCFGILISFFKRNIHATEFSILFEKNYRKMFFLKNISNDIKIEIEEKINAISHFIREDIMKLIDIAFSVFVIIFLLTINKYTLLMPIIYIFFTLLSIYILKSKHLKGRYHKLHYETRATFVLSSIYYFFDALNLFYLRFLFINGYFDLHFGIIIAMVNTKILHSWSNFFYFFNSIMEVANYLHAIKDLKEENYDKN